MIAIYADGICEPNPGHACWAWVAFSAESEKIHSEYGYLGDGKTNNDAEYVAIGRALRWLYETMGNAEAVLFSDSQLAVRQIVGEYACNVPRLQKYRDRCLELLNWMPDVSVKWIPASENEDADNLTRVAYKQATGKEPRRRH